MRDYDDNGVWAVLAIFFFFLFIATMIMEFKKELSIVDVGVKVCAQYGLNYKSFNPETVQYTCEKASEPEFKSLNELVQIPISSVQVVGG